METINLFCMKFLLFLSLFILYPSTSNFSDDCRVRLRYLNFNEMSKKEHLQWLNCAFEAVKEGEDKHLKTYEEWLGNSPDYLAFQKAWRETFKGKAKNN